MELSDMDLLEMYRTVGRPGSLHTRVCDELKARGYEWQGYGGEYHWIHPDENEEDD